MSQPEPSAHRAPPWVVYAAMAIVWPIWCEAGVLLGGIGGDVARGAGLLPGSGSPVFVGIALVLWAVLSFAAGRFAGPLAPRRLWVVTVAWLAVATAVALFGFALADRREVVGLLGVVGPFLVGALGFTSGQRQVAPRTADKPGQTPQI